MANNTDAIYANLSFIQNFQITISSQPQQNTCLSLGMAAFAR